jgi:hypothetical protein
MMPQPRRSLGSAPPPAVRQHDGVRAGPTSLVALVAACAVAGGCASPAPAPPAPTPPPALHSAPDQRAAERAVPTLQDLGDGYAASPFVPSAGDRAEDAQLSSCLGRPPTAEHETARAFSPQFSQGDARAVLAGITFVDSPDTARDDLAALADGQRAPGCLRESMLRQLGRSGGRGDAAVAVTRVDPPPGGAGVVAYRLTVQSGPLPVVVDLLSAVVGRAEVQVSFRDAVRPVPGDVQNRVVGLCLARLPAGS